MKFLPQVLKLCFWALPVQRVCTVAGITLVAVNGLVIAPSNQSGRVLELGLYGFSITFLPVLMICGPLWRAFASQRSVALAPHGRAKLLAAAILMAALTGIAMAAFYFLMFLWLPSRLHMTWGGCWQLFASTFVFASWWAMASFFAARSSLAMFTVLLVLLGSGYAAVLLDLPLPGELSPGGGVSVMLLCWSLFAAWYLRVRRIAPLAWTSRRADDQALVTQADTGGIGTDVSRPAALERLLLGGRSTGRIIVQWLLALALLQGMLLGIRVVVDAAPQQVAPVQFLALLLVLPAMGAISLLVASRLRPLWLASGSTRAGLFALAENRLLALATGLAVVCAVAFLLLWFALPARPDVSLAFGLCSLLGAMLLPAYAALMQGGGGAAAASIVTVIALMQTYMKVFVNGEPATSWWWLAPLPVATIALRELARRRWLSADMPRAATAPAS
jgi:hypothetical protein